MLDASDRAFLRSLVLGRYTPEPAAPAYAEGQPPPSRFVLRCPFCLDESELIVDPTLEGWAVTNPILSRDVVISWLRGHAERHRDCAAVEAKAP